mgnify:FL=1
MLEKFKNYFSKLPNEEKLEEQVTEAINYACSALLIETALADKVFDNSEIESLKITLKNLFSLDESSIQQIIVDAEKTVKESTSLYEHTKIINQSCNYEDKKRLIKSLWNVAFADGKIDKYEEHLIRKISDLIHFSHSDFINQKITAKKELI